MTQIFSFAQKALIYNATENTLVAIKYLDSKYLSSKVAGKYGLPGGQMEFGETPDAAIIRETQEETGLIIHPLEPIYIWTWTYKKNADDKQIVAIVRICEYVSGTIKEPNIEGETTLAKARWVKLTQENIQKFVWDERPALEILLKRVCPNNKHK
ncbi:MAG: NUDIX hydrolase [bacterium]